MVVHVSFSDFMASLFHAYLAFLIEFLSLRYLSSAKTTIMYATTPFCAALLSYYVRGHKLSLNKIFSIIVGFA
jgi:drug/metabolite transporter (DMT)-like permease